MSRPRVLLTLGGLISGVSLGLFVAPTLGLIAPLAVIAGGGAWITSTRTWSLVVVFFLLGWLRCAAVSAPGPHDVLQLIGQSGSLIGSITLPGQTRDGVQTIVLTKVEVDEQNRSGSVQVRLPAIPNVRAGQRVEVRCQFQELGPSWRRLWSQGVHVRCSAPNVRVVEANDRYWRSRLGRVQEAILAYVRQHYREPQASLLNGILVGNTDGMPDVEQRAFQATGTTHIVALSGFNVTIIITVVIAWLQVVVGRRWAWLPAVGLVTVFIIMSGASSSVVRAGCMTVIVHIALHLGRPIRAWRVIAYAAMIMIIVNPLVVIYDLGFQLSFLATIGLMGLSKPLTTILQRWLRGGGLTENLGTTLAAMIATEPLLLWRFGRLSLVAPIINVVVLPFIPIAMATGALSLLGLAWSPIATVAAPLTDAILRFILAVISWGAALPHAWLMVSPYVSVTVSMACLGLATYLLRSHDSLPDRR